MDRLDQVECSLGELIGAVNKVCDRLTTVLPPGFRVEIDGNTYGVVRFLFEDSWCDLFCRLPDPLIGAPIIFNGALPSEYCNSGIDAGVSDYIVLAKHMPLLLDTCIMVLSNAMRDIKTEYYNFSEWLNL